MSMSDLREYKCPACGGAIEFDSKSQKMKCPYCDTEFELETLKELDEQGRMKYTQKYMQHSDISVYKHCISVAYTSVELADRLAWNVNRRELIRGALLHDYFLYDWHEKNAGHRFHGFIHAGRALQNARKDFKLTIREENIILRHMFPLNVVPPMCKEAWLVCLADKICVSKETVAGRIHRKRKQQR